MNVNKHYLKKQLQKRKEEKIYEIKPIGSAIRYKRKALNLTLEEASEGICSVSYLSKLENNLIEPGERFIEQLTKKFNIENSFEYDLKRYDEDKNNLIECLLFERKPDKSILDPYIDRDDHQAFLIQLLVHLMHNDYILAVKAYQKIKYYISNLMDDELSCFLISSSMILAEEDKYSDAYELLELYPKSSIEHQNLHLILMKHMLMNAFKMKKAQVIVDLYPVYSNELIDLEYFDLLKQIKTQYLLYIASDRLPSEILSMASKMNALSQDQKDFAYVKSLFHHGEFESVYELSKSRFKLSSNWLIYYLFSCDKLHLEDDIKQILSEEDELKHMSYSVGLTLLHFRYKYLYEKDMLLNYLRKDILGYGHLTDDYLLLDYMMMDAQSLFAKHQFYKEAVLVISHLLPKLKSLKQAMIA